MPICARPWRAAFRRRGVLVSRGRSRWQKRRASPREPRAPPPPRPPPDTAHRDDSGAMCVESLDAPAIAPRTRRSAAINHSCPELFCRSRAVSPSLLTPARPSLSAPPFDRAIAAPLLSTHPLNARVSRMLSLKSTVGVAGARVSRARSVRVCAQKQSEERCRIGRARGSSAEAAARAQQGGAAAKGRQGATRERAGDCAPPARLSFSLSLRHHAQHTRRLTLALLRPPLLLLLLPQTRRCRPPSRPRPRPRCCWAPPRPSPASSSSSRA